MCKGAGTPWVKVTPEVDTGVSYNPSTYFIGYRLFASSFRSTLTNQVYVFGGLDDVNNGIKRSQNIVYILVYGDLWAGNFSTNPPTWSLVANCSSYPINCRNEGNFTIGGEYEFPLQSRFHTPVVASTTPGFWYTFGGKFTSNIIYGEIWYFPHRIKLTQFSGNTMKVPTFGVYTAVLPKPILLHYTSNKTYLAPMTNAIQAADTALPYGNLQSQHHAHTLGTTTRQHYGFSAATANKVIQLSPGMICGRTIRTAGPGCQAIPLELSILLLEK